MRLDPKLSALAVHLHGRQIGVITRLVGERSLFAFEQDYVDDRQRPALSLSFKGTGGGLVTSVRPVARRSPPFFSNLLPEGHLRTYLAEQAGIKPEREFFLLAALGADLPGAVTIMPLQNHAEQVEQDNHNAEEKGSGSKPTQVLRFSLAGVQLKFSAAMEAAGGLTIPAQGIGGSWIVKLPSARFPHVPENEYAMLELARAIGITVPELRLVPVSEIHGLPDVAGRLEGSALVIKRFDRGEDGTPVHMEDFAQVFGLFPDDKYGHRSYANIASVLWAETGAAGTYEFVRRVAFSVLIGNGDMHLKNWSLLYPDRRTPVLSPAYDFVATLPYIPGDRLALSLGGERHLDKITPDQVRRFADKAGLPTSPVWETVQETVERTVAAWQGLEHKQLLPPEMQRSIETQIETVARNTTQRKSSDVLFG
jgi:serine/threonine-protein kinase HipA